MPVFLWMSGIVIILLTLWILTRLLVWLMQWKLRKHFQAEVKVGWTSIFNFGKVYLKLPKQGLRVEIENIGLTSCILSPRTIRKLLVVCATDIRIQVDISGDIEPRRPRKPRVSHSTPPNIDEVKLARILSICQYVGICVQNVTVILIKTLIPHCMLHVTGQEITVDIASNDTSIQAMLNINGMVCRALQSISQEEDSPCLAEIAIGTYFDISVARNLKSVKSARILVSEPRMFISEGFLRSIPKVKMKTVAEETPPTPECEEMVKESPEETADIFMIIPKEFGFYISNLAVSITQEAKNSNLSVNLKTFHLESHHQHHHHQRSGTEHINISGCLLIEEFIVTSPSSEYAHLEKSHLKLQINKDQSLLDVNVSTCHLHWQCDEMKEWESILTQILSSSEKSTRRPSAAPKLPSSSSKKSSLHLLLSRTINHKVNLELSNVLCGISTYTSSGLVFGLTHLKATWNSKNSKVGIKNVPECSWLDCYDVSAELDVQSVYCQLATVKVSHDSFNNKRHYWDNIVYLGIIMIRVSKLGKELKVNGMKDNIQLEWSTTAMDTLVELVKYLPKWKKKSTPLVLTTTTTTSSSSAVEGGVQSLTEETVTSEQSEPVAPTWFNSLLYSINYKVLNLNLFACNNQKVCLLLCLDAVSLEYRQHQAIIPVVSCKLVYLTIADSFLTLQKCADIKDSVIQLHEVQINYKPVEKGLTLLIPHEIQLFWETCIHCCLIQFLEDVQNLQKKLKELSAASGAAAVVGEPKVQKTSVLSDVKSKNISINLILQARAVFSANLPGNHNMTIFIDGLVLSKTSKDVLTEIPQVDIHFDDNSIFYIEDLLLESFSESPLQREREAFKEISPYNRALIVSMKKLSINFPYEYNIGVCFEEVINITKWLKLVHKIKRKEFTSSSKLPPDIKIKIQEFCITLGDDPFEVTLNFNYELLQDEWVESEKRRFVLDQKILNIQKSHGLLPCNRFEELYTSLAKKSAEIYIQRSKQLYAKSPIKAQLLNCQMENLEIVALADLSYHGKEAVVEHMKQVDPDSPYPEEGLEFNTLWCRMVTMDVTDIHIFLRDYPQSMLEVKDMHAWGKMIGAAQEGIKRSKRMCSVEIKSPWEDMEVERSLPPIKFFYDLSCDIEDLTMAYGSCWEPTFAQVSLMMEMVNRPSVDPSRPLPFWDKLRLLFHGRLTMSVQQMRWLYHASFDPCNITEFMDWTWRDLILDWTNGKFALRGDLDVYARTASKYDDCRLLHLPNLKFCVRLEWMCLGDPNDHHSVMPCAPDKVPDYSMEAHDSFKGFRSQHLNLNITLETKPSADNPGDIPICLFFASTLRFMDRIKLCLSRVTRPIKRGILFQNTNPKKPQLSRHYKQVKMSVNFPQFSICYWMSYSKQHGVEMHSRSFNLELCNELLLLRADDGLIHRPQSSWGIRYLTCELSTTKLWLCSVPSATEQLDVPYRAPVEKNVFLSVSRVSYQRADETTTEDEVKDVQKETPTHMVQVYDMKGAWTRSNRTVLLGLYDSYIKAQSLKRNLSSEALKGFKLDNTRQGYRSKSSSLNTSGNVETPLTAGPIPLSQLHSGHAYAMLNKLVSETDKKSVAFTEEPSEANMEQLHGIAACQTDDVIKKNWLIELFNSQVMLKGCETVGYVIVSAAKAQILSCIHKPFWKGCQLCSKTTWVGSLECMQYYATVDLGEVINDEDIAWLSKENIEDRSEFDLEGLPEMVSSGQSVGGVVNSTVGDNGLNNGGQGVQLQRIVSRCRCQFFYAGYGEVESEQFPEVLPMEDPSDMIQTEEGVDTTTVLHHDLNVCTNSLQYATILDIINNLLLHVERNRKQAGEKLQSMRFQLQLSTVEDQRSPILLLQENVRKQVQKLRKLEKDLYMIHKALEDECADAESLHQQSKIVEMHLFECKEQINGYNEELTIRISCYKESQVQSKSQLQTTRAQHAQVVRRNEVCFKFARWRLTEADGQLGIADLVLRNFVYTKVNRDNDTWSHQLELGWVRMTNLIPNPIYKDVLVPRDPLGTEGENKQMALRIFCSERPPVGGIAVKEHFEVNVVPLQIQLTYQFFKAMMVFFFPERNIDIDDQQEVESDDGGGSMRRKTDKRSSMREKRDTSKKTAYGSTSTDDIDKMKERAANNNTFLYIKIPEVSLKVSYKGEKEKNIEDLHDCNLVLPTLEYHNCIWTWFDLLMSMKNDSKKILLAQALRQKFHVRARAPNEVHLTDVQQEEDKAKMLLGAKLLAGQEKPVKKSLFAKPPK
ncbi:Hypothetical predicted protein [Octopus vulgaris]|uniref:FMP27/BLTP2/Hobbit GFWDK motif-containing RBG unit domain-containing protein n=1 Tax=Octopus vulgaris TaxID=6645 RepID=A0AA36FKE4_OCTVU|nr:Hypothetical predicted protein [Octopus vulgaris]